MKQYSTFFKTKILNVTITSKQLKINLDYNKKRYEANNRGNFKNSED